MTYMLKAPTREKLMRVGTANIANVLLKHGFNNVIMHGISPISTTQEQLVGSAYTLRFIPAREDLSKMSNYSREDNPHRRAIEECPKGSVLVIDAFGCTRASSMGDMMAARLKYRGVAGVVTDGGYRDSSAIYAVGLPCFQQHNAPPATPIAMHPIALNEPIGCAGVAIYPGDVVVGDGDGVVVIPQALADQVANEALDACEYEAFAALHIRQGRSIFGLFPATAESRLEYSIWKSEQKQEQQG
ncbi:MAG: dimethylmenaquinone methyltransferase [Acinetobacter guillouiae]